MANFQFWTPHGNKYDRARNAEIEGGMPSAALKRSNANGTTKALEAARTIMATSAHARRRSIARPLLVCACMSHRGQSCPELENQLHLGHALLTRAPLPSTSP
eukprot:1973686-Amphidinium_carterae.1